MLTVYAYDQCSTCRTALAWLAQRKIPVVVKPIRSDPPSRAELLRMLTWKQGVLRSLFNTSGRDYRAQKLGSRLDAMEVEEAVTLLAGNGNLIKRPFVLGPSVGLVGFDPVAWGKALR